MLRGSSNLQVDDNNSANVEQQESRFEHEDSVDNPWALAWRVDSSALVGMPKEYSVAACDYINSAIKLLEHDGWVPERLMWEHTPSSQTSRTFTPQKDEFPIIVEMVGQYNGRVTISVLPEPAVVRAWYKPPDLGELAVASNQVDPWDQENLLDTTIFFVPKANCESWRVFLPTPHGFSGFRAMGHENTLGWQYALGRAYSPMTYEEFVRFPELEVFKDQATWNGALAARAVVDENKVLRWVYLNRTGQQDLENWLAYAVIDANGAYSGTIPYGPKGITTDTFLRRLDAPFTPLLEVTEGLADKAAIAPTEHNLLRTPTPQAVLCAELPPEASEDWTITEGFYAEHLIPAWALWADKDTRPFREHFYLKHALEPSEHVLWKVVVFANIRPNDLVKVIGRMKGIADVELPPETEIDAALGEKYAALRTIVAKLQEP